MIVDVRKQNETNDTGLCHTFFSHLVTITRLPADTLKRCRMSSDNNTLVITNSRYFKQAPYNFKTKKKKLYKMQIFRKCITTHDVHDGISSRVRHAGKIMVKV
jgi:hypothetical protein